MNYKYFIIIAVVVIGLLVSCTPATSGSTKTKTVQSHAQLPPYSGPKANVVVSAFECKAAKCSGSIGRGMADALISSLVMSNRFDVLEASGNLGFLESELNVTGESDNFAGADIAIVAVVTAFEPNASGAGAGGIILPLPFVGGVGGKKKEAYVAIDLRLVEVRTRRIITASKIEGQASRFGGTLFGGGVLGGVVISGYQNTPMEKAISVLIDSAVLDIVNKVPPEYYGNSRSTTTTVSPSTSNTVSSQTTQSIQSVQESSKEKNTIRTPFGCILKPYTIGVLTTGDLTTDDCAALFDKKSLVDYYEFKLDVVDTVTISLTKGEIVLYKIDGSQITRNYGSDKGVLSKNLEAGIYVIGIASDTATSNYNMAVTTTKVGFGGCPIISKYTMGIHVNDGLNASDCFRS